MECYGSEQLLGKERTMCLVYSVFAGIFDKMFFPKAVIRTVSVRQKANVYDDAFNDTMAHQEFRITTM